MAKGMSLFLAMTISVFGIRNISFAMMCAGDSGHGDYAQAAQSSGRGHAHGAMPETKPSSVEADTKTAASKTVVAEEVGNTVCPVSGEKIDEKMKATYEYEGKIYNFCCPSCVDEFKKDPQKYIKKIKQEKQERAVENEKEQSPQMHEHSQVPY